MADLTEKELSTPMRITEYQGRYSLRYDGYVIFRRYGEEGDTERFEYCTKEEAPEIYRQMVSQLEFPECLTCRAASIGHACDKEGNRINPQDPMMSWHTLRKEEKEND